MKTALIVHDSFANPTGDWIPWVKAQLESRGYFVWTPGFPTPVGQSYASWRVAIEQLISKIDTETILIGHGTGALFVLKLLAERTTSIKGIVLVSPYAQPLAHAAYQKASEDFLKTPIDWTKAKQNSGFVTIIAGNDDPFVPLAESQFVAQQLSSDVRVMEGGGHLNRGSGYTTFVELIAAVQAMESATKPATEIPVAPVSEQAPSAQGEGSEPHPEGGEALRAPQAPEANPAPSAPLGFHGMEADLARAIGTNSGDIVSNVLLEARQLEATEKNQNPKSARNILFGVFGTILLLAGLGFLAITLMRLAPQSVTLTTPQEAYPSIMRVDRTVPIVFPTLDGEDAVLSALLETPTRGTITALVAIDQSQTRLSFTRTLELLGVADIPPLVRGYVAQDYTWGIWGADDDTNVPFLILRVTSYDGAFSGIREWEPRLPQDIGIMLGVPEELRKSTNTFSGWTEILLANRPVRVLREAFAPAIETVTEVTQSGTEESVIQTETESSQTSPTILEPAPTETTSQPQLLDPSVSEIPSDEPILYTSFLSEQLLLITPRPDIIPELIRRLADRQILE